MGRTPGGGLYDAVLCVAPVNQAGYVCDKQRESYLQRAEKKDVGGASFRLLAGSVQVIRKSGPRKRILVINAFRRMAISMRMLLMARIVVIMVMCSSAAQRLHQLLEARRLWFRTPSVL